MLLSFDVPQAFFGFVDPFTFFPRCSANLLATNYVWLSTSNPQANESVPQHFVENALQSMQTSVVHSQTESDSLHLSVRVRLRNSENFLSADYVPPSSKSLSYLE